MTRRAWLLFGAVSLVWGVPYFFIKIAVDDGVPPAFLAWARVVLAALLLGAICWRLGLLSGLRGHWRVLGVYAVIEIALPFPLIAAGEQEVSSSLTAILIASGLDPARCVLFRQSDVPQHTELNWLLTSVTAIGELNRMHQCCDKSAAQRELVSAGLLFYPVLQAADVLAYRAGEVPVGAAP